MYNQVIFYNHFGAGDIFESREFVKAWMKLIPSNSYHYAHGKNPRILLDIPELQFKEVTEHMNPMRGVWDDSNGNLYVNTWIGRDGRYVLPGIGCTVEKLYEMHNEMLVLGLRSLDELGKKAIDYIPDLRYLIYDIEPVNKFLIEHNEEKIFIDNGNVQSMQAENFPMDEIINEVAANHKDKAFIVTHALPLEIDNVYPTSYITQSKHSFDLPEISYLSVFCSTLIGRNSGPHVFTQVKRNIMDRNKKLLSFTYQYSGSSFVVNTDVNIKKYWSAHTKKDWVIREIEKVLQ